ncbi:MAG TPA: EAL domain-containing protein [Gammaproteobacteria bacterium]|nr:EAL domain-containing protein [Chromatiaceae bacterium]MCP5441385.1 EAL domain-containing protein [Chromatiaceae bacterium]MCW5586809.1 EAL domain-containing protein [Chromatiales bacterium]HOP16949.1 EAL domain-containing protein [Gammaproteobacteria bacterium]HPQ25898.1 EAL domain-containing protein [Gammaproteobacteria bacterium]
MNVESIDVLLVEDNPQEAEIVRLYLAKRYSHQYAVHHVRSIGAALTELGTGRRPSVILLDLHLPDTKGLDGYKHVSGAAPGVPVIILTNCNEERTAASAVRAGAQDYLIKREVNAALLHRAILYAMERQRAEQALIKVKERYALAVAGANDCIWDWEAASDSAYFSPRWNELLGLPETVTIDRLQDWFDRVHPEDIAELRRIVSAKPSTERQHFEHEHRLRHESGDYIWVYARGVILTNGAGKKVRMAGSISSIAKRKETENQLIHRALHDALTGLPNRVLFIDRLQQALRRFKRNNQLRFAVLYFDLDRFKFVNDSLGHSAGDSLLVSIARRLISVIRPGDTIARMGGDEFAVLVSDIADESDTAQVSERIHNLFLQEFSIAGRGMYTSASIGIAVATEQYDSPEEVLRDADLAMYRAKRSETENTVIFDPTMHQAAVSRLNLETELRRAMARGEFVVYYQPIVTLTERRIVAFEALLRWVHPERGLLAPDSFLNVIEDTGMLATLSWWVIEQACQQAREWRKVFVNGSPLGMSVNVSASMFRAENAAQRLKKIVTDSAIAPQDLSLELTERDCMDHEEATHAALAELRRFGVKIHMDDFGTGYSSLSYLQRCSYDTLKIDRSFVHNMGIEDDSTAIIKTIVGLGRMLNMNVVAEGVESQSQFDALVSMDCPEAQGFWFSEPVPPNEAGELIRQSRVEH